MAFRLPAALGHRAHLKTSETGALSQRRPMCCAGTAGRLDNSKVSPLRSKGRFGPAGQAIFLFLLLCGTSAGVTNISDIFAFSAR